MPHSVSAWGGTPRRSGTVFSCHCCRAVPIWYYGKNTYDTMGSQAHEAFVYNVAMGRLDVYTFDVWDLNECRCGRPQEALEYCDDLGFYRWNINAIAWTVRKVEEVPWLYDIPSFDEPHVSMIWYSNPHRVDHS